MKMTKSLLLTITALLITGIALTGSLQAQTQSDLAVFHPEMAKFKSIAITENDYECFQHLDCIKDNYMLSLQRWNISLTDKNVSNAPNYVLKGEAENEMIRAIYNAEGSLLEAEHIRKNTRLPNIVRNQINQPEFSDWRMTNNQIIVKDFSPEQTTYIVQLEKLQYQQEIHFNYQGEMTYRKAPINISQDTYSCFRSIECLKNNPDFKQKGWHIQFSSNAQQPTRNYILESHSNNIEVQASYNTHGQLIEATLIRTDSKLPIHILEHLFTEHEGWSMTSNRITVKDFDPEKVSYEISLEKDGKTKKVKYDGSTNLM